MRAAIYIRVSTDEQAREGYSLESQLHILQSYCEIKSWTVVDVYTDDGYSAKDLNRPQVKRMMKDIEDGRIDMVLIWKLDRLTRSVLNLHQLLQFFSKHNVGFNSTVDNLDTKTAAGRLFITIIGAVAEWERENLAERVRMGMLEMTQQGKWSGGRAAFGYRYEDGMLRIYEPEAKVVREIFKRYTSGVGTTKLLAWLNNVDKPQLAPRERWTQNALKYLLRNPLYAGMIRYGYRDIHGNRQKDYMVVDGQHKAIITKEIFECAENVRLKRRTEPGNSSRGNYPLTGIIRCGRCGSPMNGRTKYRTNKSDGRPRRNYICIERQHSGLCKMPTIKADDIEMAVLEQIHLYYEQLPTMEDVPARKPVNVDISAELAKLRDRRMRWMDAFEQDAISVSDLRERTGAIDREEMQLRSMMTPEPEVDANKIRRMMETLYMSWDELDPSDRKEWLQSIIERVDVESKDEISVIYRI